MRSRAHGENKNPDGFLKNEIFDDYISVNVYDYRLRGFGVWWSRISDFSIDFR